ncbi:BrnA antitoxin family protein [bacterium]|nr:BrnA antitoxin family protein [bacterium]MBU1753167.1 BrnA antitoxin family protein [bacterium]
MARSRTTHMPKFNSLNKLVEFFETHDMGEYWDDLPDVRFDIDIKKRTHIFTLDEDLVEKVTTIAQAKQIPSISLINEWLREKILEQVKVAA